MMVYQTPASITGTYMTTCGGCGHGLVTKLVAELIDELELRESMIMVLPIGCATNAWEYYRVDAFCALHGRAPAVATGIKRTRPDNIVVSYQGDGDLVSEGLSEIMHAAIRGEKITVIFMNNAIFGMTGGQMAPTTLLRQVTTTSPHGKSEVSDGYPVKMAELLAGLPGCYYSERVALHSVANIRQAKRAIRRALQYQMEGRGLSFVEVLSPCPTGWRVTPVQALEWIGSSMVETYPLGVYKEPEVT
ncbi:thiamine pyrophosphate-dependent enzyme [uncultured Oscillibacter sp.]|uniref:thiamine pyrophosphate-dependent enzyme n=1 Tax=uncultured Oscillibacter sp. TaxID=876091 RepID=UPI0025DA3D0B|nr:thiamine pyrophosphate-dependent enzyme [uncultured Oscillibacter sp.]